MRLACLLLAAGGGVRFGGPKQLAPVAGKALLRHGLDALTPLFGEDLYVVLGARWEKVEPLVAPPARVIVNPRWRDGLGSSISHGLRAVRARGEYRGLLIALADQVRLGQRDFAGLIERFDGERIVAARYAGAPGVPAIFPAALFDRLQRLDGDSGARAMLREMAEELVTVPLPQAEHDIDTPDDIGRAR